MKAGETNYDVDTRIKVLSIADDDPDEKIGVVGSVGTLTHPFGDMPSTILGVWVEKRGTVPPGTTFPYNRIGLGRGDTILLIREKKKVTL